MTALATIPRRAQLTLNVVIPYTSVAEAAHAAALLAGAFPEGASTSINIAMMFDSPYYIHDKAAGAQLGAARQQRQEPSSNIFHHAENFSSDGVELSPLVQAAMDDTAGLEPVGAQESTAPSPESQASTKRTRRTKAEMEAARAAEVRAGGAADVGGASTAPSTTGETAAPSAESSAPIDGDPATVASVDPLPEGRSTGTTAA